VSVFLGHGEWFSVSDAGGCYPYMEMPTINNGVHSAADRPSASSPVDRIPSTYFPFPLSGSDGPFFPPTAEAFMQAAAAAAAAAVGRQVPGAEPPSFGTRPAASEAAPEESTRRGAGPYSSPVGDRVNPAGDDEDEDAMSALSCGESEGTASPGLSPGRSSGRSPGGTADLVSDPSSPHRATSDVEMMAS